nr:MULTISPECIES: anti sigma factor C-terminal domain-containing protein [Streptococcus]
MSIKLDQYEKEVIGIAEEISYYLQKSGASPADSQDIAQDVLVKLLESDIVLPLNDLQAFVDKFGNTDFTKQEEIDQLEFAGIILTGKAEDFAQLEGKDWIYASSIGASIPIQPYYQLHH